MDYSNDPKVIDGKKLALNREEKLRKKIEKLKTKPKIVSILIGDDESSLLYSKMKQKKAQSLGIDFEFEHFRDDTRFEKITDFIDMFNNAPEITGIMIQLPLPVRFLGEKHNTKQLLELINPKKDIDGLTPKSPFQTAAVVAVFDILEDEKIKIEGKKAVVIGASDLIGKPIAKGLEQRGASVKIVDSQTPKREAIIKAADILISATGVAGLVTGDMVKDGVVVIDVGVMVMEEPSVDSRGESFEMIENKKIVLGDVDFESVYKKASKITPVPGGVGPVTVIALMENAVKAA